MCWRLRFRTCHAELKEAAETVAKMIHEQTFEEITNNPTMIAYVSSEVCTWAEGWRIEPLSVSYHDTMKDDPKLIVKVVAATATPDKPDPAKTLYFVISNEVIGSGIIEGATDS